MRVCVRACVRARVRACVRVCERERVSDTMSTMARFCLNCMAVVQSFEGPRGFQRKPKGNPSFWGSESLSWNIPVWQAIA